MKKQLVAVLLVALIIGVTPATAAEYSEITEAVESGQITGNEYNLAGSEIKIINGMPYIVAEIDDRYVNIPLPLSNTIDMMVYGVPTTVEVDGNYLLIPTEDGIERVCISEFDVKMVDGQLMLVHEVNPALSVFLIKVGVTVATSKIYIWILEHASRRGICFWCEVRIKAAGAGATFLWGHIMKKMGAEVFRNKPHLNALVESIAGTIHVGVLARSIAFTANVIGTCSNRNCLFHPRNH